MNITVTNYIQNVIQYSFLKVNSTCKMEKKWEHIENVRQLFIDFKKVYDSVRRESLHNILTEFRILRN